MKMDPSLMLWFFTLMYLGYTGTVRFLTGTDLEENRIPR